MSTAAAPASAPSPIAGKTAVVTGASRGIGRAIALRLAALGAHVLLVGRDAAALERTEQTIRESGGSAEPLPCDLLNPDAVAQLAARLAPGSDGKGGCDILVNAAGIGKIGQPLHQMSLEDFYAVMATNLHAPFLLMRAVVPAMIARGGGFIVNISSLAGQGPLANGAAYATSKWGLNGLSYSAAEELRAHNIRVCVVAPGSTNTSFGGGGKESSRKLQAEDVAAVVAMLVTQPPQSFISEVRMRPTQKQ